MVNKATSSVGDPWHFGPDPDPIPTSDPTPFFSDFKFFFFVIYHNLRYPEAHYLQASVADPDPGPPDPHVLGLLDPDPSMIKKK
jgi:hypothetical protein